jgi:hypothetical protein
MPSLKLNRLVAYESTLERDLFTLLEFDPNVIWYEEQPMTIAYSLTNGRRSRYTPDALVEFRGHPITDKPFSPLLIEVKPRKELSIDVEKLRPRMRAGRRHAQSNGWRFRVLTEREIRVQPLLPNARFLLGFRTAAVTDTSCIAAVRMALPGAERRPLMAVATDVAAATHESSGEIIRVLWSLIATHVLAVDLMRPLAGSSEVWWPDV